MIDARETGLIARREIQRNLQSAKGAAMFAVFFLGGAVPPLLQVVSQRIQLSVGGLSSSPDDSNRELRRTLLEKAYGVETADYLTECPSVLFFLMKGALVLVPLLVLFVSYDQLVGELQHGTARYFLGRARRASIVAGKALGIWAVVAALILALDLTVVVTALLGSDTASADVLTWGARIWVFLVVKAAAFVGLMAAVSARARAPNVALFGGAAILFAMALVHAFLGSYPAAEPLQWLFPAAYEASMLSPDPRLAFEGGALFLAWGAAGVVIAAAVVQRRDL